MSDPDAAAPIRTIDSDVMREIDELKRSQRWTKRIVGLSSLSVVLLATLFYGRNEEIRERGNAEGYEKATRAYREIESLREQLQQMKKNSRPVDRMPNPVRDEGMPSLREQIRIIENQHRI